MHSFAQYVATLLEDADAVRTKGGDLSAYGGVVDECTLWYNGYGRRSVALIVNLCQNYQLLSAAYSSSAYSSGYS